MYLIQPRCHLGKSIVYDTVSNLSWSVDIRKHGIINVIEEILGKPWQPSEDVGRSVPPAAAEEDCVVSGHNCDSYGTQLKSMELAGVL
jgi:lipase ATG15